MNVKRSLLKEIIRALDKKDDVRHGRIVLVLSLECGSSVKLIISIKESRPVLRIVKAG